MFKDITAIYTMNMDKGMLSICLSIKGENNTQNIL